MKKYLLALACCGFLYAGNIQYANEVKDVYLNYGDKKASGRLLPTNGVEILEKKGSMVKFKATGFMQNGVENVIYFNEKDRILVVAMPKKVKFDYKVLEEKNGVKKVSAEFWTKDDKFESALEPMMSKAKTMFAENCGICHKLHPEKEFNANQWPATFKAMADRTAIDKKDRFLVIQYLQKNAK